MSSTTTDQMDGLPVVSKLYLSSSCPELKAESVISDFSDTEEILSEIERVVTPPIQEEQEEFIIESTSLPSPIPLSRIGLPTTTTTAGLAIPTALPSSSPLSSRRSLEWQFKGLTVWLELEEFDNDLTRAVEYFSSKHNSPFIPQSHTTAIYGMEHLSIEEARARLRTVRDLIPQWPTFAKPTGITSDIAQCGRPGQVCDIAWSELTLATNPQHEAALDILYELFYGSVYHRDRPWKPHNSVAYDNPDTNHLSLLDTIMYASQNPSLLGMERRVAAIALWSTVGKMGDWECLERVRFID
mmetsp:Transcript_31524/g.63615  ORF Transcript_31524/g.63615 Transcript_31524/m.63615 type:complete len:299 (-) Transcript_31524:132-1028(-)